MPPNGALARMGKLGFIIDISALVLGSRLLYARDAGDCRASSSVFTRSLGM